MRIEIAQGTQFSVDRSGVADPSREMRQGFHFIGDGVTFEFEDEADAVLLAKKILYRMGYYIYTTPKELG